MRFTKRIIQPGQYTIPRADGSSSQVTIDRPRIQRWAATFETMRKAGLSVPAPWRHDARAVPLRVRGDGRDVDAYHNAGFWNRLWVDKDGSLIGEVDVPRAEDADRLGKTVTDVSLLACPHWMDGAGNTYQDALTHIALVTHPVVPDKQTFAPSELAPDVIACSLSQFTAPYDPDDVVEQQFKAAGRSNHLQPR